MPHSHTRERNDNLIRAFESIDAEGHEELHRRFYGDHENLDTVHAENDERDLDLYLITTMEKCF